MSSSAARARHSEVLLHRIGAIKSGGNTLPTATVLSASREDLVLFATKTLAIESIIGDVVKLDPPTGSSNWLKNMPGYSDRIFEKAQLALPAFLARHQEAVDTFVAPIPKSQLTNKAQLHQSISSYAKELEKDFGIQFQWYNEQSGRNWPSFLTEEEKKLTARGKLNAQIIIDAVISRWERACLECDRGRDHPTLTLNNIYRQLLLFRARSNSRDPIFGCPVFFLHRFSFFVGGIGHWQQKIPMATEFSEPNGSTRADERAGNILLRSWRTRQLIVGLKFAGQASTSKFIRTRIESVRTTFEEHRWVGIMDQEASAVVKSLNAVLAADEFPVLLDYMKAKQGEPGYRAPSITAEARRIAEEEIDLAVSASELAAYMSQDNSVD